MDQVWRTSPCWVEDKVSKKGGFFNRTPHWKKSGKKKK